MALSYNPEWLKAAEPIFAMAANAPKVEVGDALAVRERTNGFFGAIVSAMPMPDAVEETLHTFKSFDGHEITVHRFVNKNTPVTAPGPALVHFHGGGLIALSVKVLGKACAREVEASGVQTFSVEYRLAPEAPFPIPVEDCYAGVVWVQQNAAKFNIDPARIAVTGESAGGNLAAGVALMARDRALSPPLAKQILVYPMLDDRSIVPDPVLDKYLVWTIDDNITGWQAYVGKDKIAKDGVSHYAAPARAPTVEGLPSTYIDTGNLDLFRDEDLAYASRLAAANIDVEIHIYPGVPHGFEVIGPQTAIVQQAMVNRTRAKMSF